MKTIYKILLCVFAVVLIIGLALTNSKQFYSEPTQDKNIKETVKIGLIAPLSGAFAEFGMGIRNAADLAILDTQNSFTISYGDEATCDTKKALSAATKLFTIEAVNIIIGPGCASNVQAILPLTDQYDALLFSTGLLSDDVFIGTDNLINLATQISTEAQVMAKYMNKQGFKRIAMVRANDAFGEEYGKRLPEFLDKLNIEVVYQEAVSSDSYDYKGVILKILNKNPDVIWVNQGQKQIGLFAKQLREMGSALPVYSSYTAESESTISSGGLATDGIRYTYPLGTDENSTKKNLFEKKYVDMFKTQPNPNAYYTYDGIMLLDKALQTCAIDDSTCIERFFKNYGTYNGVSGEMKIEKDGSNTRPFGIKEIRDGKFEWVSTSL